MRRAVFFASFLTASGAFSFVASFAVAARIDWRWIEKVNQPSASRAAQRTADSPAVCLLYTSDAAYQEDSFKLRGRGNTHHQLASPTLHLCHVYRNLSLRFVALSD